MCNKKGITTRLDIVVMKTTLETNSDSLLYFVARVTDMTDAGIAESRITTDLNMPVRLNRLTVIKPNSKPTPILRKEARKVVGSEVSLTTERLRPKTSSPSGITIMPMKFSG